METCPGCGVEEGVLHRPNCAFREFSKMKGDLPSLLRITIPPEVAPYIQDIRRFVDAMVYKLSVHAAKGRWDGQSVESRIEKLEAEVQELKDAVARGNMVEILLEAADVGNYGLIISSIAVERGK